MNDYIRLKKQHQQEMDAAPLGFAFNDSQFGEMMEKWGLKESDTDKICGIGVPGAFIQKKDAEAFNRMCARHRKEEQKAVDSDASGDGYIYWMFYTELQDHEYGYTGDVEETLDALGYTYKDIEENSNLRHGLTKAARQIMAEEF